MHDIYSQHYHILYTTMGGDWDACRCNVSTVS